jgi:DNA polymerase I-like protein with 3'-5' exonuclease and polymerase domains
MYPVIAKGIKAFPRKSDEWSSLRDPAKNTNFAVPYGANWKRACVTLGLPPEIGRPRFENYRTRFPKLCNMTRDIIDVVQTKSGVETTFGRFLYVPKNKAYMGVNYLIQATAGEILKRAQVRVHRFLEEATGGECGILLPIHDELIIEWPRKMLGEAPHMWRKIRELMIDFPQFDVPLDVSVDVATVDWSKKSSYNFL